MGVFLFTFFYLLPSKTVIAGVFFHSHHRLGEVCQEYLKKGSLVYLEGRIKTDKYEEKGETRYFTKVVAQSLEFLDKRPAEEPMMAVDEDPGDYEA